jgi:DNA-binding response OmpR family regulator/MinD-like ATPase involved in chromosome partitioning or flagellar assembly
MAYKILIIDDHPETRSIIGHVLKQQGYHIVTAENGAEGLKVADQEKPHIILCDYMMPVMDGVEAVTNLRQKSDFDKVPIIMFTAVDDPQQKLAAFNAGADDYLNKPTEPPELVERVVTLLESAYGAMPEPVETDGQTLLHASPNLPPLPEMEFSSPDSQHIIAVMGVRGGAGTTTMAINLATALSASGTVTTLADFDLVRGHIALYLNQKTAGGVNTLATSPNIELAEQVPSHIVAYTRNMSLLLAQLNIDSRYPTLSGSQAATILTELSKTTKATVVDLGSSLNEIARSTLEMTDQIVLCLRPERIALVSARQLLSQFKKILFPHVEIHLVLMDFSSGGTNLPKTAVEGFLGYPVKAIVHISPREMAQTTNKAKPLVTLSAQSDASMTIRQFAQELKKV